MKVIIISVILLIITFATFIPIKEQWVEDSYLYGDYFCSTGYQGVCISTSGHSTLEKMTLLEYFTYKFQTREKEVRSDE